jgi:2-polyprenyl-3-methyl-5-hydroxy-6-metoxy-1,4-benzoquinol methylase
LTRGEGEELMIGVSDRRWNSPTTLYIARRLEELAQGRQIAVLDMACGDGRTMEHLVAYGSDLFGYDLVRTDDELAW